jgi:hypothetical protein
LSSFFDERKTVVSWMRITSELEGWNSILLDTDVNAFVTYDAIDYFIGGSKGSELGADIKLTRRKGWASRRYLPGSLLMLCWLE